MRNFTLHVFRGTKANIPALGIGELYLATDEIQLYVGTASGNKLVLCNTIGIGNGSPGQGVTTRKQGTGGGPTAPTTIVGYTKIIIGGTTFWMPLFQ